MKACATQDVYHNTANQIKFFYHTLLVRITFRTSQATDNAK